MKRALLASASALCASLIWVSIGAAQFNPNSPAPSQSPSNLPGQPGSLVPSPGNTNIGIPSQNIPGTREITKTEGEQSGKGSDGSRPLGQRVRETPPRTPSSAGGATPNKNQNANRFQQPGTLVAPPSDTNIDLPSQNIPGAVLSKSKDDSSRTKGVVRNIPDVKKTAPATNAARISPLPRAVPGVNEAPNTLPLPGGRDEPTRERDPALGGKPPAQDAGIEPEKRASRPDAVLTGNQVPVPAGLEELLKLFGGNLDAVDQLKELVEMLRHGPHTIGGSLFGGGREAADPMSKLPFGRNPSDQSDHTPGSGWNPFGGPTSPAAASGHGDRVGWVSTGGMQWGTPKRWRQDDGTEVTESHGSSENLGMNIWRRDERNSDGSGFSIETVVRHGSPEVRTETRGAPYMEGGTLLQKYDRRAYRQSENSLATDRYWEHGTEEISTGATARAEKDAEPYFWDSGPKPKDEDSMPAEGYGRYTGPVVCPLGGCRDQDRRPPIYVNPGPEGPDGPGSRPANVADSRPRTGPGAATDPNPDDIGAGSGGGGASRPDPCRYAQGPSCGDAEPGAPSGPPLR